LRRSMHTLGAGLGPTLWLALATAGAATPGPAGAPSAPGPAPGSVAWADPAAWAMPLPVEPWQVCRRPEADAPGCRSLRAGIQALGSGDDASAAAAAVLARERAGSAAAGAAVRRAADWLEAEARARGGWLDEARARFVALGRKGDAAASLRAADVAAALGEWSQADAAYRTWLADGAVGEGLPPARRIRAGEAAWSVGDVARASAHWRALLASDEATRATVAGGRSAPGSAARWARLRLARLAFSEGRADEADRGLAELAAGDDATGRMAAVERALLGLGEAGPVGPGREPRSDWEATWQAAQAARLHARAGAPDAALAALERLPRGGLPTPLEDDVRVAVREVLERTLGEADCLALRLRTGDRLPLLAARADAAAALRRHAGCSEELGLEEDALAAWEQLARDFGRDEALAALPRIAALESARGREARARAAWRRHARLAAGSGGVTEAVTAPGRAARSASAAAPSGPATDGPRAAGSGAPALADRVAQEEAALRQLARRLAGDPAWGAPAAGPAAATGAGS